MRRTRARQVEADSRPPRPSTPRQHSTSTTSQTDSPQADDVVQCHGITFLQKTEELLGPIKSKEFLSLFRRVYATQEASDRHEVVRQGRELLEDHKSLLLFFNIFLPVQDRMTMPQLVEYSNKHKYFLRKVRTRTNLAVYIQCATILGMTEQDKMSATDAQEQLSSVLKDQLDKYLKKDIRCLFLQTNPSYVLRRVPLEASTSASKQDIALVNHFLKTPRYKGGNGRIRNNAYENAIFDCEHEQSERDMLLGRLVPTIDRVGAYLAAKVTLISMAGKEQKSSCPPDEMFLAPTELGCIRDTCNKHLLESIERSAVENMYFTNKWEEIHKRLLQVLATLRKDGKDLKLQRKWRKVYLNNHEGALDHLRNDID